MKRLILAKVVYRLPNQSASDAVVAVNTSRVEQSDMNVFEPVVCARVKGLRA